MRRIKIKTPSRLHFGIINIKNANYRLYGSLGLALDNPYHLIEINESENLSFKGITRADVIERIRYLVNKTDFDRKVSVNLLNEIPAHVGLGSTTQLILAISEGYFALNRLNFDPYKYALDLQIGKISGIGIGAYLYGGFLIDDGKESVEEIPKIKYKRKFPEEWCFILLLDKNKKRIYGEEEKELFKLLPITPSKRIHEMIKLVEDIKMALEEKDIINFGKKLTDFQRLVGMNFYYAQQGIYVNEEYINILLNAGAYGVGQSSWGPVVYGLVYKDEKDKLIDKITGKINKKVEIITSYTNNYGRNIEKYN